MIIRQYWGGTDRTMRTVGPAGCAGMRWAPLHFPLPGCAAFLLLEGFDLGFVREKDIERGDGNIAVDVGKVVDLHFFPDLEDLGSCKACVLEKIRKVFSQV